MSAKMLSSIRWEIFITYLCPHLFRQSKFKATKAEKFQAFDITAPLT